MVALLGMQAGEQAWTAGAEQSGGEVWQILGVLGPVVLVLLLVVLIVRALLRQRRYRAVNVFSEADRQAVREAVAEAEKRTIGEVLPVVVERSDPHPAADWRAALLFLLAGTALLAAWLPWNQPALLLLCQLAIGLIGFGVARRLPDFKRLFISERRATSVAEEQAFQEFYANGLHKTEAATGVLLFVSLLEHRAIILADEGIDAVANADFWAGTDDAILAGIRKGSLREGLIDGIHRVGELLEKDFPWREGDRNEIPNRVIVRKE